MSKASVRELSDQEKVIVALGTEVIEDSPDQVIALRFRAVRPFLSKLFKSGVEARGIERVLEHQRESKYLWNNLFMWCSSNMMILAIPIGVLGQYSFSLTLPHAIATLFCFGALGSLATAFIATLGPQTGLRTMVISRYSSGFLGCVLFSVINILVQFGFGTTCVIIGGQTLASINPDRFPLVVGIIILGICSLVPCFIGYDVVHIYERYAWIVTFIIMCCLYGLGSKAGYNINAQKPLEATGKELAANVLSYGGAVFASFAGWALIAADYNCRLPVDTSPWHVFMLTFWGLYLPTVFTITLGAALMTITDPTYVAAFGPHGNTGALVAKVLSPWAGGGKFLLVLLAFSVVANNIPATYSGALGIQALCRPFAMVPRFLWVVFISTAYTVAGVAGREHFSAILGSLLSIQSYAAAFFVVIVAEEHFLFRRKSGRLGGYNLADWDSPSKLPLGIAGLSACCFGIVGTVLGMSQEWYTGPIARMVGRTSGADLGFELAAGFAAVTFAPLRWLEICLTGR